MSSPRDDADNDKDSKRIVDEEFEKIQPSFQQSVIEIDSGADAAEKNEQTELAYKKIPYLHPNIDINDLDPGNNKLLSDEQIERLKSEELGALLDTSERTSKKDLGDINYSITKINDRYFAIYRGKDKEKSLGSGGFGSVKLAQDLDTGKWYAIKIIKTNQNQDLATVLSDLEAERAGLEKSNRLQASYDRKDKEQTEFIMKLAPGQELYTIMGNSPSMPAARWLDMAISSAASVDDLHSRHRLLLRDIKPENIMYGRNKATAIDLGFAVHIPVGEEFSMTDVSLAGSAKYMAPEIKQSNFYSDKSDIYALGMTLAQMLGLTKNMSVDLLELKSGLDEPQYVDLANEFVRVPVLDPDSGKAMLDLVRQMTDEDPVKRPSLAEVLSEMRKIRSEQLDVSSRIKRLGYIDVNEYLTGSDESRSEMIKALKQVDEVCLIDRKENNDVHHVREWMQISQELERAGLAVSPQLLQCDIKQIPQEIEKHSLARQKSDNDIYNNIFVSTFNGANELEDEDIKAFSDHDVVTIKADINIPSYDQLIMQEFGNINVSEINYNKMLNSIADKYKEIDRLEMKSTSQMLQLKYIENLMLKISSDKNTLSYGVLFDHLNSFKINMDMIKHRDVLREKIDFAIESYKDDVSKNADPEISSKIEKLNQIKDNINAELDNLVNLGSPSHDDVFDEYNDVLGTDIPHRVYSEQYELPVSYIYMTDEEKINHVKEQMKEDVQYYEKLLRMGDLNNGHTQWRLLQIQNVLKDIADGKPVDIQTILIKQDNINRSDEQLTVVSKINKFISELSSNEMDEKYKSEAEALLKRIDVELDVSIEDAAKKYDLIEMRRNNEKRLEDLSKLAEDMNLYGVENESDRSSYISNRIPSGVIENPTMADVCRQDMERIIKLDGDVIIAQEVHVFDLYFDVNANQIKEEYAGYEDLKEIIHQARDILIKNNILITLDNAKEELELIIADKNENLLASWINQQTGEASVNFVVGPLNDIDYRDLIDKINMAIKMVYPQAQEAAFESTNYKSVSSIVLKDYLPDVQSNVKNPRDSTVKNQSPDVKLKVKNPPDFIKEQKKLRKLTAKLNKEVVEINRGNVIRKGRRKAPIEAFSRIKKYRVAKRLNSLEGQITNQQEKMKNMWPEYRDIKLEEVKSREVAKGKDERSATSAAKSVVYGLIANAYSEDLRSSRRVLGLSKNIIPDERVLPKEAYRQAKDELENLLLQFKTLASNVRVDGLQYGYQGELNQLNSSIEKKMDEISALYSGMRETKKPLLKKLKGGEVVELLTNDKTYIQELNNKKRECAAILEENLKYATKFEVDRDKKAHKELLVNVAESPTHKARALDALYRLDIISNQFENDISSVSRDTIDKYERFKGDVAALRDEVYSDNHQFSIELSKKADSLRNNAIEILGNPSYQFLITETLGDQLNQVVDKLNNINPNASYEENPASYDNLARIDGDIAKIQAEFSKAIVNEISNKAKPGLNAILVDLKESQVRSEDKAKRDLIQQYEEKINNIEIDSAKEYTPASLVDKLNSAASINLEIFKLQKTIFSEAKKHIELSSIRVNNMRLLMKSLPNQDDIFNKEFVDNIRIQINQLSLMRAMEIYESNDIAYKIRDKIENEISLLERQFVDQVRKEGKLIIEIEFTRLDNMLQYGIREGDADESNRFLLETYKDILKSESTNMVDANNIKDIWSSYSRAIEAKENIIVIENEIIERNAKYAVDLQNNASMLLDKLSANINLLEKEFELASAKVKFTSTDSSVELDQAEWQSVNDENESDKARIQTIKYEEELGRARIQTAKINKQEEELGKAKIQTITLDAQKRNAGLISSLRQMHDLVSSLNPVEINKQDEVSIVALDKVRSKIDGCEKQLLAAVSKHALSVIQDQLMHIDTILKKGLRKDGTDNDIRSQLESTYKSGLDLELTRIGYPANNIDDINNLYSRIMGYKKAIDRHENEIKSKNEKYASELQYNISELYAKFATSINLLEKEKKQDKVLISQLRGISNDIAKLDAEERHRLDRLSFAGLDTIKTTTEELEKTFVTYVSDHAQKIINEELQQLDDMMAKGVRAYDINSELEIEEYRNTLKQVSAEMEAIYPINNIGSINAAYEKIMETKGNINHLRDKLIANNASQAANLESIKKNITEFITVVEQEHEYFGKAKANDPFKEILLRTQSELKAIDPSRQFMADELSYRQLDEVKTDMNNIVDLIAMKSVIFKELNYLKELKESNLVGFHSQHISAIKSKIKEADRELDSLHTVDSIVGRRDKLNIIKDKMMTLVLDSAISRLDEFIASVQANENIRTDKLLSICDCSFENEKTTLTMKNEYASFLDKNNSHYQAFITKFNKAVTLVNEKHLLDTANYKVNKSLVDLDIDSRSQTAEEPASFASTVDRVIKELDIESREHAQNKEAQDNEKHESQAEYKTNMGQLKIADHLMEDQLEAQIASLNKKIQNILDQLPVVKEHILTHKTLSGQMVVQGVNEVTKELHDLSKHLVDYSNSKDVKNLDRQGQDKELESLGIQSQNKSLSFMITEISEKIDECDKKAKGLQLRSDLLSEQANSSMLFNSQEHENKNKVDSKEKKAGDIKPHKSNPGGHSSST